MIGVNMGLKNMHDGSPILNWQMAPLVARFVTSWSLGVTIIVGA